MKNDDTKPIGHPITQFHGLKHVLDGPLSNVDRVVIVTETRPCRPLRQGFHIHDEWELFCPLNRSMNYELAGSALATLETDNLLLLAPGILHLPVLSLPQADDLCVVLIRLSGVEIGACSLYIGGLQHVVSSALSAAERRALDALLENTPTNMMRQVAKAISEGSWGKERALGFLRILLAGYAQVIADRVDTMRIPGHRKAMDALAYLQSRYYDRHISVSHIGRAVGLSASHLASVFREATGNTLHQTLIDIRLRRAMELLRQSNYSIKEIAVLTGWSSQFHLSATVLRRYGNPPCTFRQKPNR